MNRRKIFLIIALMGLSITGITLMQIHWMLKTIKLNEENFDRAINETLATVVDKLEKEKDIKFSIPFKGPFWYTKVGEESDSMATRHNSPKRVITFSRNSVKAKINNHYTLRHKSRARDYISEKYDSFERMGSLERYDFETYTISDSNNFVTDTIQNNEIHRLINNPQSITITNDIYKVLKDPPNISVTMDYTDTISRSIKIVQDDSISRIIIISDGHVDTINRPELPGNIYPPPPPTSRVYFGNRNNRTIDPARNRNSKNANRFSNNNDDINNRSNPDEEVIALNTREIEKQTKKQQQALKQLIYEMDAQKTALKERVDFQELHHLIDLELKNKGVMTDFEFALVTKDSSRKEVFSTPMFNKLPTTSTYKTRLFPNNYVPLNDFLEVKFPSKDTAIYKSVILPISASLFFTLIVFLTFAITLVIIIKQKKLAEMKADFINNMTHELKTPIATISLASDSIDNPKVVEKPESVKYFTAIIREENSRMNKLVESVLQTARLERKTLKLNQKEVNLSILLEKVADQMKIQADAKGGFLTIHKPDYDVFFFADESLMENVIFNLIDNAIKYSNVAPLINITLKKLPGGISLSCQDNGIGMSRSEQQRVFEKFYRVSQGDVHNIKGFGLGLSNVKEITELHGGIVHLRSELGNGSTFTIFFPNKVNGNE